MFLRPAPVWPGCCQHQGGVILEENQGYVIRRTILFDNKCGFVLGENPKAPNPYVTWQFNEQDGHRDFFWGHYHNEPDMAERDLHNRAEDYQRRYHVFEVEQAPDKETYKYYSTQRPIDIGTYKVAAGKTAIQTMEERFAYGLNPKKLGAVSAYLCDPASAPAEFLLLKSQYQAETGRAVERGALFFQIRQAFPPGEVTPEEANKIGYETAMRWTKGKYQFFVCTHIDKGHIHNHIYYNSTAQDCSRKFHNFIGSSFAVRRLSDRVCIEHELSVIQNPKQHSKGRFLHYGQWIGEKPPSAQQRVRLGIVAALEQKPADFPAFLRLMEESGFQVKHGRGGAISFLAPGQDKYTRLRASTLGPGFDPDDIRAAIAGERPIPELPQDSPAPARRVNLIIDIQERMAQGKGPAYERWAKVYNIKQMAAALLYLREHGLSDYEALATNTEAAVDLAHKLAGELRDTETALSKTSELMGAVVQYAKTRPVFDGYKAARYSRKYLAQHEAELADYRAAKAAMSELLGGAKLPKMDTLKKQHRELSEKKKALYAEYRKAQADMRQAVAVKANIDHLLGHADEQKNKAQER